MAKEHDRPTGGGLEVDLVHFAIWKSQRVESLPGMRAHDVTSTQFKGPRGGIGWIRYDATKETAMIEYKGEVALCPFSALPEKLKELWARG